MIIVELIRLEESEEGTLGVLKINKQYFCSTLEPSDKENKKNVSSIPAQQYMCEFYSSPKYEKTYQVMNVPDRDYILFHAGNTIKDTKGCILLGQYPDKLRGDRAVLNSGETFKKFLYKIAQSRFHLTIKECY